MNKGLGKNLELNATCEQCGAAFHVKPSALIHTRYCKECHDKAQRIGETITCEYCGKESYKSPSSLRWERNFCSNNCRRKWLSQHVRAEINVEGHSKGHKAPHLTKLNLERNPKLALEFDAIKRGEYSNHRRIMEEHLGRKLEAWEDVHHINGIHSDNRLENLVVLPHREHMKLHWKIAKERGLI